MGPSRRPQEIDPTLERLRREVLVSYETPVAVARLRERAAQGLRRWEAAVVLAHMTDPGLVAVLGCGAGRELFALSDLGWTGVGLDISRPALNAARELSLPISGRWCLMDGAELPIADQSVDSVTLWSQVLAFVPSERARLDLLAEARRILRPGGTVSLSVHDLDLTAAELEPEAILARDDPEPGDFLLQVGHDEPGYCHYFRRDELFEQMTQAGFGGTAIASSAELGESWGNLLIAVAHRPLS